MRTFALPLAVALLACLAPAVHAAHFDVIHVSQFDARLCDGCGITLAGADFGLLVNTGAADLAEADLQVNAFTATSSHPDFDLLPFLSLPGLLGTMSPPLAPIHPHEAVGSISQAPDNTLLLPLVGSGETLRDLAGQQFLAFEIRRAAGSTYEGPVTFVVRLQIGGEEAEFPMVAQLTLGQHQIAFTQAARTSSVPLPVPARPTSWGAIKSLYR